MKKANTLNVVLSPEDNLKRSQTAHSAQTIIMLFTNNFDVRNKSEFK